MASGGSGGSVPTAESLGLSPKQFGIWQRQQLKKQKAKAKSAALSAAEVVQTENTGDASPETESTKTDKPKSKRTEKKTTDSASAGAAGGTGSGSAATASLSTVAVSTASTNWSCSKCRHSNPTTSLQCAACAQPKFKLIKPSAEAAASTTRADQKSAAPVTVTGAAAVSVVTPVAGSGGGSGGAGGATALANLSADQLTRTLRAQCSWLVEPPIESTLQWKSPSAEQCRTALGGRPNEWPAGDAQWLALTAAIEPFWLPFPAPTSNDDWCIENREERPQSFKHWQSHGLVMSSSSGGGNKHKAIKSTIYLLPIGPHFAAAASTSAAPSAAGTGADEKKRSAAAKRMSEADRVSEAKRIADQPIVFPNTGKVGLNHLMSSVQQFACAFFSAPVVVLPPLNDKAMVKLKARGMTHIAFCVVCEPFTDVV